MVQVHCLILFILHILLKLNLHKVALILKNETGNKTENSKKKNFKKGEATIIE